MEVKIAVIDRQRIAENLSRVQDEIASACRRAGRDASEVTIVAITKSFPLEVIRQAIALGINNIGENRVQDAAEKIPKLKAEGIEATWHMVGPLQKNKVKKALELFDHIHSVESLRLAQEIEKWAAKSDRIVAVFIEVNTSGESQKHGFLIPLQATSDKYQEFWAAVEHISAFPHLAVLGLMTIAPLGAGGEGARPYFRQLRKLGEEMAQRLPSIPQVQLSMGMSEDFEVAIEEGATMLRIGQALFGPRPDD